MDFRVLALSNNVLTPRISDFSIPISGLSLLVQRIVKVLLMEKGSNRLEPDLGVGIGRVLPSVFDDRELEASKLAVTEALVLCEGQIKADDALLESLPEERLENLFLRDLRFESGQWVIDVSLRTMAHTGANISLASTGTVTGQVINA